MTTAKRRSPGPWQADLFGEEPKLPGGFAYREEIITPFEEEILRRQLQELPFEPFDFHGYLAKRRVVSFGWRYDYGGRTLQDSDAIPPFLLPLRERAAAFAGVSPKSLQQILINEYTPGAGIGWHRDKPMFEDVIAVSLSSACVLRFRRKLRAGWERASRDISPRSADMLRGPSRRDWEHSIPPVDALRYSVTFRNFVEAEARDNTIIDRANAKTYPG